MGTHTVEKIGGTSMSRFDVILDNVILGQRSAADDIYHRIFVVSAYGGITDLLLEHKKTGEPGVYKRFADGDIQWDEALTAVARRMCEINAGFAGLGLDVAAADEFVHQRIKGIRSCLHDLRRLCSYGHFQLSEYLPVVRELLSSVGEAHSASNTTMILKARGLKAIFVDLTGWMEEQVLPLDETIHSAFAGVDFSTQLPIVTGYAKCAEGLMSAFDRGYSEITFSKIATVTEAREGVIHKEYHLSSGDPKVVGIDRVKIIGKTNYDVADQLADLGMEAIHPKAAKGMEKHGIPIRVTNAFEPEHPGTLISADVTSEDVPPKVQIVCGCPEMLAVEVRDPDMVGQSGYDYRLLRCFNRYGISYVAKNTNANTITHYVPEGTRQLEPCLAEIREAFPLAEVRAEPVALVSVIGSNMKVPGILARAANTLAASGINVLAVDQCMRQVNMQFIIARRDFQAAIRALHRGLVEEAS